MASYRKKIVKLSRGQIAKNLIERTDIGLLDRSGQEITNFRPSKFGGIYSTKGSLYQKTIGTMGTIAKKYKVSLPNDGRARLIINFTAQTMYIVNSAGVEISNVLDVSTYLSEDEKDEVRIAQQGELIIISSLVNPLLKLTITEEVTDYSIAIEVFEIAASNILKATTITSIVAEPTVVLLDGDLPTEPTGLIEGKLYLDNAPTPPSATFPWTTYRYDGLDEAEAIIWTEISYTPDTGDLVQYLTSQDTYAWSGTAWGITQDNYNEDKTYAYTITPTAESGIVDVKLSENIIITAPAGQDAYTYAKNLLSGIWLEGKRTPAVCYIQDLRKYAVSGQKCYISKFSCYTLVPFVNIETTIGFTLKFSMKRAFDSDYAGTANNPEGTSNFPLSILFYQQRLIIAGTQGDTTQMLFSKEGIYNDFAADYSGNNAFQLRIGGTEQQVIQNVIANQGIQIFTDIAEWVISSQVITGISGFTSNSEIGSSYVNPIISANGTTLFCPKDGLGIIGLIYNYENANFATPPITLLTDIFNSSVVDLVLKKSNSPNSDNLIFSTLQNGKMIVGNYLSDQQIQAFTLQDNELDTYEQVLQVEDDLTYLVNRNGNLVLEKESENVPCFCATENPTYDDVSGEITGLDIYNGREINIYNQDGDFVEVGTPANGSYTLVTATLPTSIKYVGYNIHSKFTSNPINRSNETFGMHKSIRRIELVVDDATKADYITVNGKKGRVSENLVTFTKVGRPKRKQQYTIENDRYLVNILSIDIDFEV